MSDKKTLREFRRQLVADDGVIDPADPRYVPNLHGTNEEDVVPQLADDVLTRGDNEIFYFTGQRGTGKSTELRRLEVLLDGEGAQAIRFDSLDYISHTDTITAESLLLLVTAGLADWARAKCGEDFLTVDAWQRFRDWLQTDLEVTDITAVGVKVRLKERQATVIKKIAELKEPRKWAAEVATMAEGIVEFIRHRNRRHKIVIIVDSLEQLRGVSTDDQNEMFHHVVTAFSGDFDRLRIPGASTVYSTPPYLSLLADVRNYVPTYSLASVRVYCNPFTGEPRQPRPEGLASLSTLIERRYAKWATVLTRAALERLALASGGDLRHFMQRLVSGVVSQAQFAIDRLPLRPDDLIVQRVIDENRGETERLTVRAEWPLLKKIALSHNAIAEDRDSSLQAMARLFETRVILNYRNGQEWFDVHPLLWQLIDEQPS